MKFIALKTNDGQNTRKIAFYCKLLHVSRQGFYKYLKAQTRPWKYQDLADAMLEILAEDECNDTYGRIRMYQALRLKQPQGVQIPSERTVYRIMEELGISHTPRRKPNGITRADKETRKSDDLLRRNFDADKPLTKCVTDITEVKGKDGKLYVSAVFDCYDSCVLGLAMDTNMRASLCVQTLKKQYGIEEITYENFSNNTYMLNKITQKLCTSLQKTVETEPDKMEDVAYLDNINKELNEKNAYLVVRKGNQITYNKSGLDSHIIASELPVYGDMPGENDEPYYITLKLEPSEGDFLRQQYEDIIPGYYMNKTHWNSIKPDGEVPDDLLKDLLDKSYQLVLNGFRERQHNSSAEWLQFPVCSLAYKIPCTPF